MFQTSALIKSKQPFDFATNIPRSSIDRIIVDMTQNVGHHVPGLLWNLQERFGADEYAENFKTFDDFLTSWIGAKGKQKINQKHLSRFQGFLEKFDQLNIFNGYFSGGNLPNDLMVTDLGTIMDLNLIYSFLRPEEVDSLNILEVGGGYGRLAEAFLNVFEGQIKYVLVDAVPESLLYAYFYLKAKFPNHKVGFYYNEDPFDLSYFDCYILPTWHFEKSNNLDYDLCVNIESMQEMEQNHVDYYLNLFNSVTKTGGIVYCSNAHDYKFKGNWNFPETWETLFKHNTPRSWTKVHPTQIFRKGTRSYKMENYHHDIFYDLELANNPSLLKKS